MKGSTADYQAEKRISEFEERSFKTIKSEQQKEKKTELKKMKRSKGFMAIPKNVQTTA